jgi:hypothetical protein
MTIETKTADEFGQTVKLYSAKCDQCRFQSLWHSDPAKAVAAVERHAHRKAVA